MAVRGALNKPHRVKMEDIRAKELHKQTSRIASDVNDRKQMPERVLLSSNNREIRTA